MNPNCLSHELRCQTGGFLRERRAVVALSLLAIGSMSLITLYQMGIIKHLPEPRLPRLDADKVDAAGEAYEKLSMPDAALGLGSYAATLGLASMGAMDRTQNRPWIPLALAGKAMLDAAQAAKLTWDQWAKHKAFCSWCLLAAAATFATLPLTFPEARQALRALQDRRPAARRPRH